MEHRKESNLCSKVFGISCHLREGLRTGTELKVVEDLFVLQDKLRELVGESENDVDVRDR